MWVSQKTSADHDSVKDGGLLLPFTQGDDLPLAGDGKIWALCYTADFSLKKGAQMSRFTVVKVPIKACWLMCQLTFKHAGAHTKDKRNPRSQIGLPLATTDLFSLSVSSVFSMPYLSQII